MTNLGGWRKRHGYSCVELSKRIGVHVTSVARWERGRHDPLSNDKFVAFFREYYSSVFLKADRLGMGLSDLARVLEIPEAGVKRLSEGTLIPTASTSHRIARFLDASETFDLRDMFLGISAANFVAQRLARFIGSSCRPVFLRLNGYEVSVSDEREDPVHELDIEPVMCNGRLIGYLDDSDQVVREVHDLERIAADYLWRLVSMPRL